MYIRAIPLWVSVGAERNWTALPNCVVELSSFVQCVLSVGLEDMGFACVFIKEWDRKLYCYFLSSKHSNTEVFLPQYSLSHLFRFRFGFYVQINPLPLGFGMQAECQKRVKSQWKVLYLKTHNRKHI